MSKRPSEKNVDDLGVSLLVERHETAGYKPGPPVDPTSARSLVAAGEARYLKVALPTVLHKRLHVLSVESERTVSDLVAEAVAAHYGL